MTEPGSYIFLQDDQHNTTQERGTPQYKVCLSKIMYEGAWSWCGQANCDNEADGAPNDSGDDLDIWGLWGSWSQSLAPR